MHLRNAWIFLVLTGCGAGAEPARDDGVASGELPPVTDPQGGRGPDGCAIEPPLAPARRLTRAEYNATVRDLLGETQNPADAFPAEVGSTTFGNDALALDFSSLLMEQYFLAAQQMATRVTAAPALLSSLLGCDPALAGEAECAASGIATFGLRAYRRPLEPDEAVRLNAVYAGVRASSDFPTAMAAVLRTMLQAPQFLYRVELGTAVEGEPALARLNHYEVASRLSYLFWGSMPDAALFEKARAGQLGTPEEVLAEARRLLADPKARELVGLFHRLAFKTGGIASVSRDAATFPKWLPGTGKWLAEETRRFLDHVTFEGGGTLTELFTAPYTFVNRELANFYGVPGGFGEAFALVELDAARASGFVTQAGLLALLSSGTLTNPVRRGAFIRADLLCDPPPSPPADLMVVPPKPLPGQTTREGFAEHSNNDACAGCHSRLDPLGFAFENFDAAGLPRTEEVGKPIDTSGALVGTDVDGAFASAPELMQRIAQSEQASDCYVKHWYEFGYGRGITPEDECAVKTLAGRFRASGLRLQDLVLELTQIDSFSYKQVEP
jgi:hypothetical protein